MEILNLIIENPFAAVAVVSLGLNLLLLRMHLKHPKEIGTLQALSASKDNEIKRLLSERHEAQAKQNEPLINLREEYERKLQALNQENSDLRHREALRNSGEPNSFEPDWELGGCEHGGHSASSSMQYPGIRLKPGGTSGALPKTSSSLLT